MRTARILLLFSIILSAEAKLQADSRDDHQFIKRQTSSSDPGCTNSCSAFLQDSDQPGGAPCTAATQKDLQTCLNCLASESGITSASSSASLFNQRCASSGITVSAPSGSATGSGASGNAAPSSAAGGVGSGSSSSTTPTSPATTGSAGSSGSSSTGSTGSNSTTGSQQKNGERSVKEIFSSYVLQSVVALVSFSAYLM